MSIFPFIDGFVEEQTQLDTSLPIPKEYAWDFENDKFKLKNGKMYIVEGNEAIKIWAYKALKTDRYRYSAYSWNFGSEIESLIGSGFSKNAIESEVNRYIQEALLVNPYITNITGVHVSLTGDILSVEFTINTIYGEVELNV